MKNRILVCILNYHQGHMVEDLIRDIENQTGNFNITIAIGDTEPSVEERENLLNIKEKYKNVLYYEINNNLGYAKGNNFIIKKVKKEKSFDYILISNPDIRIPNEKTLEILIKNFSLYDDCAVVGPKVVTHEGRQQGPYNKQRPLTYSLKYLLPFLWYPFWKLDNYKIEKINKVTKVWRLIGAFMLINNKDFQAIGYFDENTFLYWEEEILSYKMKKINKNTYYDPSVTIKHLHGSAGKHSISKFDTDSMKYYFKLIGEPNYIIKLCEFSVKSYNFLCRIIFKE